MMGDVRFGRYRFDVTTARLWCGKREVRLTPKAAAVLRMLVARAGQPVTREALFASVWRDTVVGDDALTSCVQELREALADDAKHPRFIETRHRRGYRFVARIASATPVEAAGDARPPARIVPRPSGVVVGRERELSELRACLDRAARGQRQIVFVTGEVGIGKTTIVEAFVADAASTVELRIGQGRCIEHYGAGEAYLPVLEALTRLCREPGGERLIRPLRQHAPTWLVQMPSLLTATELTTLQRQTAGVTRERMLRELAEAVEVVTAEQPLVLWLEDLHWSDVSTLDWLAYVARRPEPARLLVLGLYRSHELAPGHPLAAIKDELELHGRCRELALALLDEAAVAEYLDHRFPSAAPLTGLASAIHCRTEGNPLFVVNVVTDLVSRGVLVERDGRWEMAEEPDAIRTAIPADVRGMIARQLERVRPDERRILEAALAAGAEFSSAAVAAGVEVPGDEADACCAALARRESFLVARGAGEWPDGTLGGRYGFRHALYHDVVYERVPAARRAELHRRIGARLEAAFGDRAGEVATELAMHFQRARDAGRAIRYLHRAGEIATQRSAPREAVAHLTDALALVGTLPESPEVIQQEIALQIALGPPLMAIKGWGSLEVQRVYARAQELCERIGDPPQLFQALWGLWQFRATNAELGAARALGERLLTLASRTDDAGTVLEAHHALWTSSFFQGELLSARDHVARGITLYDPDRHAALASVYGHHDPGVCGRAMGALALELLGESEQATRHSRDAIVLARTLGHAFSETQALLLGAFLYRRRGEWEITRQLAEEAGAIARQRGFVALLARATTMQGWAMAQAGEIEDGIARMQEGIEALPKLGLAFLSYLLGSLAEGHAKAGRVDRALEVITEALAAVERTGERFYEAELVRLRGELWLTARRDPTVAEQCFRTAMDIARRQGATTLERRAQSSLDEMLSPAARPPSSARTRGTVADRACRESRRRGD